MTDVEAIRARLDRGELTAEDVWSIKLLLDGSLTRGEIDRSRYLTLIRAANAEWEWHEGWRRDAIRLLTEARR